MGQYDKKVIDCFLKNQRQLFPEDVASTPEEAEDFLDMVFATVVSSKKDVRRYFEEDFIDFEGSDPLEAMSAATLKKILLILRAAIPWRPRRSSRSETDAT